MEPPGYLDDLDRAGRAEWQARAERCIGEAAAGVAPDAPNLRLELPENLPLVTVEWTGFPERVGSCLGRQATRELLDAAPGLPGGRPMQEEYLEWRVVRDGSRIKRLE